MAYFMEVRGLIDVASWDDQLIGLFGMILRPYSRNEESASSGASFAMVASVFVVMGEGRFDGDSLAGDSCRRTWFDDWFDDAVVGVDLDLHVGGTVCELKVELIVEEVGARG